MFSSNTSQVAASAANYIEDVFSTWLYTGNGSSQTITNGIDLAGRGGMVWIKNRNGAEDNVLFDTNRGAGATLYSNATAASDTNTNRLSSFNSDGFSIGSATRVNTNASTYVSWSFRDQAKFFDVVTYTGNGVAGRTVSHNLGSEPGCLIVKCTSTTGGWATLHKDAELLYLQSTNAQTATATTANRFGDGTNVIRPTDTVFTVGTSSDTNSNGATYVAYLFAHNAGGFGLTGTDNVISCGSFTTDGSGNATVDLGYEPQWTMIKRTDGVSGWNMYDNMRGWSNGGNDQYLQANSSAAEQTFNIGHPTATGMFLAGNTANAPYIYIAIRRGPMKVPTTGTSVYNPVLASATAPTFRSSNFTGGIDAAITFYKPGYDDGTNAYPNWQSRLTGTGQLQTPNTRAEITIANNVWDYMNGQNNYNGLGTDWGAWLFKRAPGFFDVVCYTGNFTNRTIAHNLAAVPELMIIKNRSAADRWSVYSVTVGPTGLLVLNTTAAADTAPGRGAYWNSTAPTASVFSVGQDGDVNNTGSNYVNYLFASCPGVSKVGSFTGTGATQVINCGFTGGARFVLIKATSTTGNWLVWDSARGIVSGNDPYLALNSTAAEVTNTDWVDTAASGFELSNAGGNLANSNGVSYVFLAVA